MKIKLCFYHLVLLFIIGGLFGYFFETFFYLLKHGKFMNKQGLWFTIIKPIYGICLILMTLILFKLKDKSYLLIFILGILIGSSFEYIASLFQEYIFKTSTWDYKKMKGNLNGRINIYYSLIWGLFAVIWIKGIYPHYLKLFYKLYQINIFKNLLKAIFLIIIFDLIFTSLIIKRYSERKRNIDAQNKIEIFLDKHISNKEFKKKYPYLEVK